MSKARPARPRRDGHRQLHRLHLGVGLHLPVQPVPVPVDLASVPGFAVGGDGPVRGPHGKMAEGFKAVRMAETGTQRRLQPGRRTTPSSPTTTGKNSTRKNGICARRWSPSAATARCTTSASRTCRAPDDRHAGEDLVVDTQVYSNTGGQACTSGFIGQVADMSPYGKKARQEGNPQGNQSDRHGAPPPMSRRVPSPTRRT
jgi:pyruvate-ferredoxin/flavodoxin oxidoreductase